MRIFLSLFSVLISFWALSQVRVVTNLNDSGPGSLRQQCYNALDGDTITFSPSLLANGSDTIHLTSNIILNKGLVFLGINTAADTLYISGSNQTQIFYFDLSTSADKDVHVMNMTFIEGFFNESTYYSGGAFCIRDASCIQIESCKFARCSNAEGQGGAILLVSVDSVSIGDSDFVENSSVLSNSSGGAISVGCNYISINNCKFVRNYCNSAGGALSVFRGEVKIAGSQFEGNSAIDSVTYYFGGGALSISTDRDVFISSSSFSNNLTYQSGGALGLSGQYSDTSEVSIRNCTFAGNTALTPYPTRGGGAIYALKCSVIVNMSTFRRNYSRQGGGAIFQDYQASYSLRNVSFVGNTANVGGSAIYVPWNRDIHLENVTIHSPLSQSVSVFEVVSNSTAQVTLENSIIYGSNPNFGSNPTSLGHNIFSNSPSFAVATDQVNIDSTQLNLEPLADNGGFAPTRVPGPGSVALNMGTPTDFSPAQNGPIYGRRDVGAAEARTIISDTLLACSPINWWGNTYSAAGTYTDTVFNANSIDSVGILVLERQDTTVVNQNAVLLALEDDANTTYQWVDCDNGYAPIAGETSMSFTPATNGNYAVILTNGTCSDTSACILYIEVSVAEENGQPSLRYYPNPTQGKLTIATTGELPNHVSILDLSGRPVGQLELESNTIQLPELRAGMYILQWKWESGRTVTSRVVVQ